MDQRDMELLRWLIQDFLFGEEAFREKGQAREGAFEEKELLRRILGQAAEQGLAEGNAFLLDELHRRFPVEEESFEF